MEKRTWRRGRSRVGSSAAGVLSCFSVSLWNDTFVEVDSCSHGSLRAIEDRPHHDLFFFGVVTAPELSAAFLASLRRCKGASNTLPLSALGVVVSDVFPPPRANIALNRRFVHLQ